MGRPTISIIVPVYNVEAYVEDCILSVMRQTYSGSMECIVVDDCGTDKSMAIVERMITEYKGPIDFKILRHTHNRGLSAARNSGINAATGEYLFFLDSDDEITDDCLEVLSKPLESNRYDLVTGAFDRLTVLPSGETQVLSQGHNLHILDNTLLKQPDILRTHWIHWETMAWNKLCRTGFIVNNDLLFKEGLLHEDNLWGFQIAGLASTLYTIDKVTYYYKIRIGSIINRPICTRERAEALTSSIKEMRSFVQRHHISDAETFIHFTRFFYIVLDAYSSSKPDYIAKYKELRPYIKTSILGEFRRSRFNIKSHLSDFHFFMPACIAPYWQHFYYFRLRPSRKLFDIIRKTQTNQIIETKELQPK